jgi:hypothetical protein
MAIEPVLAEAISQQVDMRESVQRGAVTAHRFESLDQCNLGQVKLWSSVNGLAVEANDPHSSRCTQMIALGGLSVVVVKACERWGIRAVDLVSWKQWIDAENGEDCFRWNHLPQSPLS